MAFHGKTLADGTVLTPWHAYVKTLWSSLTLDHSGPLHFFPLGERLISFREVHSMECYAIFTSIRHLWKGPLRLRGVNANEAELAIHLRLIPRLTIHLHSFPPNKSAYCD